MTDEQKANAKVKELVTILLKTPPTERKEVDWEVLTEYRLEALKSQTWENAVRLAILNKVMEQKSDSNPFLPQKVIDFLKPVLVIK